MRPCCPPGHGCNADGGAERCALDLCRAAAAEQKDAALTLRRWSALVQARGRGERECRFRRRAFERARDRALIALALQTDVQEPARAGGPRGRRRPAHGRPRAVAG